jgi:hypothetical protein
VRRQINARGGSDAKQLETVASSPALGAPTSSPAGTSGGQRDSRNGSGSGRGGSRGDSAPAPAEHGPSAFSAIATAATHGGGSSIGALVVGLLLISAVAVGLALVRRRRSYLA